MKAILQDRYGPPAVLRLAEVPTPAPAAGEVLVRVRTAAVNAGDLVLLRGRPLIARSAFGLFAPKIGRLGSDMAGSVEAVGAGVSDFRPGDAVLGHVSEHGFGAFAEYVCAPADAFVPKPAGVTFAHAAAIPGSGLAALQALRMAGPIEAGDRVLVIGASGGVGTSAVQIAKAMGAEVTGVCSTRNVDMVRSIGADHVIDYRTEDFTRNGRRYDAIVDAAAHRSLRDVRRPLAPEGVYVMIGGSVGIMLQVMAFGPALSRRGGQKIGFLMTKPNREDLSSLGDLAAEGKLVPVIDRRFTLEEVPAALDHLEAEHGRGKIVIDVERD